MSATIKYKGNTIATINTDTSKTLKTSGTYCEGDIIVENVQDGGITSEVFEWQQTPEKVQEYLDYISLNPYDANDYSYSYFDTHTPTRDDKPILTSVTLPQGELTVIDNENTHAYKESISSGKKMLGSFTPVGASYYVEHDNNIVATGTLIPTGTRRFIEGTSLSLNMRDLGGLPCDGGKIKYNKLIRGGEIYPADTELIHILHDKIGIRAELELLGEEANGSPFEGTDVDYCCPVDGNAYWLYYDISHKENLKKAFRFVFDSVKQGKPLYFHCQQGADRTGTMALLIELVLGVPQNICDVDYELTSYSGTLALRKRNGREYEPGKFEYGYINLLTKISQLPTGTTLQDKFVNYLATLGFSAEDINGFRREVIDGNPQELTPDIGQYTVTNNLTHAINQNPNTIGTQYQGYYAEIEAEPGYIISSVQITVNGIDLTGQVWDGEKTNLYRSIQKTLEHCTIDNTRIAVIDGQGYAAEIVAENGYTLDGSTVSITMDGVDITNQVWITKEDN